MARDFFGMFWGWLNKSSPAARQGISRSELLAQLDGKTVAIVGNSRGLSQGDMGAKIDECDLVIRLNDAPMPAVKSHGVKTNWLAVAKSVSRANLNNKNPDVLLWMPTSRKRLSRTMRNWRNFYLNPVEPNIKLRSRLAAPPSVGIMVIDLLVDSGATKIEIFGFDFFATRSLSGKRTKHQVPHDFDAEKGLVLGLVRSDNRISINST